MSLHQTLKVKFGFQLEKNNEKDQRDVASLIFFLFVILLINPIHKVSFALQLRL